VCCVPPVNACFTVMMMAPSASFVTVLLMSLHLKTHCNNAILQTSTLAAWNGRTSIIELLLADSRVDKASIDHGNQSGRIAFTLAASAGHTSVVELLLADPRVDKASIDHANGLGGTALMYAAWNGRRSVVELLLADPRVDKASIDHANRQGETAFMHAAWNGHTPIVERLLADPHVDKASIDYVNASSHTALWYAAKYGHFPVAKLLINDSRTNWDSIVELTADRRIIQDLQNEIPQLIVAELTRRQMCVIYPSANRLLWPVPVQSDAKSGDAESREESDGIAEPGPVSERECALITSFFQSDLFDVNALRIIREYATYTV
jgi:Ankyrin repeats (3 copies)/Ankyrin repeat